MNQTGSVVRPSHTFACKAYSNHASKLRGGRRQFRQHHHADANLIKGLIILGFGLIKVSGKRVILIEWL